jgi:hypothetical protein
LRGRREKRELFGRRKEEGLNVGKRWGLGGDEEAAGL